jgi:hypothetical protein
LIAQSTPGWRNGPRKMSPWSIDSLRDLQKSSETDAQVLAHYGATIPLATNHQGQHHDIERLQESLVRFRIDDDDFCFRRATVGVGTGRPARDHSPAEAKLNEDAHHEKVFVRCSTSFRRLQKQRLPSGNRFFPTQLPRTECQCRKRRAQRR